MKYIKLFENFEDYDPYELMIIPPNKKTEMIVEEIKKKDKANLNLVSDLITLGANLDWQDGDGRTALYMCAIINRPEILRMLIDARADVNIQRNDDSTALHECAINNRPKIVRMLLDAGADVNIQDGNGYTALHWCAVMNRPEIAKMLISAGADLNIQDEYGRTALHYCVRSNQPEIAKMLLDAGADKTIPNNEGRLPYELAKTEELKELLKPFNENINSSITKILNDIKLKFLKETMVDEVWKLNNGYCEDIADYFIDIIGGETEDTYIIDDGWFWDGDKISNLETKTGEYWNVKNLKKYGEPPFGWENLNKLDLHGHVWIFSKGKHYDVETLNGVDNFWDLPIYKRQVANLNLI